MFSDIMHGIMITMSPDCLLALCIGAMFGTVVGALPGLGTAVAITICIPFTLQMGNASAIALLLGVYATSIYGGSISAVLLNTPGTPQSACTGFEGYAMAKAGKAEKALGWVTMSSVLGGLFSCVALVIAAPQLADLSVKYGGPLEICGLICLGLACITSLSEDNQIKGLLMGVAGLFLATIGVDPLSGEMRFTFGSPQLVSGIDLMPIVVGVFPLAELFYRAYEVHANVEPTAIDCKRISFPTWQEWKAWASASSPAPARQRPPSSATLPPSAFPRMGKTSGRANPTASSPPNPPTTRSRAARWSPRWPSASPASPSWRSCSPP